MNTQINEMIYALEKLNPQKLAQFRVQNPNYSEILLGGVLLGEEEDNANKTGEFNIKIEICKECNIEILKKCDAEFPKIKRRIKNYRKLNLLSQIITAISSAAVVSTFIGDNSSNKKTVGITMGIIGLISSIIPIFNQYIITGINDKKINESFEDMVKYRLEIESNDKELTYFLKSHAPDYERISTIINNCNEKTVFLLQLLFLV